MHCAEKQTRRRGGEARERGRGLLKEERRAESKNGVHTDDRSLLGRFSPSGGLRFREVEMDGGLWGGFRDRWCEEESSGEVKVWRI